MDYRSKLASEVGKNETFTRLWRKFACAKDLKWLDFLEEFSYTILIEYEDIRSILNNKTELEKMRLQPVTTCTLKELVEAVITSFKLTTFSLHDITSECRKRVNNSGLELSDTPQQKDPADGVTKSWVSHDEVKKEAVDSLANNLAGLYNSQTSNQGGYRIYAAKIGNSPSLTPAPVARMTITKRAPDKRVAVNKTDAELKTLIKNYIDNQKVKNQNPSIHDIQKRLRYVKINTKKIQELCEDLGFTLTGKGLPSRQVIISSL